MDEVKELADDPRVFVVQGPMCRWSMKATDAQGEGYVRKETKWMTSSWELAQALKGECSNKTGTVLTFIVMYISLVGVVQQWLQSIQYHLLRLSSKLFESSSRMMVIGLI